METRARILETPRLLRDTLEKSAQEYETLFRRVRWGELPVYICGCGASLPLVEAGALVFEWLVGWPALARSPQDLEAYTAATLRPRAVLLVVSASGEDPEALEAARLTRSRGAVPLALTRHADSPLAEACEGVFITRDEGQEDSAGAAVCQLAALSSIALKAARLLKGPNPGLESLEDELKRLPDLLEWSFTQLWDALRALGKELRTLDHCWLVGGGLYHPVVERLAWRLRVLGRIHGEAIEASQFLAGPLPHVHPGEAVVFVSGSRLRVKRPVHQAAVRSKVKGARVISITDNNDRELVNRSEMALLLPPVSEVGGAILALALLEQLTVHEARKADPSG